MKNGMNSSPGSQEKNTRPLLTYSLGFAEMCAHRSGATSLYSSMRCIQYGTQPAPASRNAIFKLRNFSRTPPVMMLEHASICANVWAMRSEEHTSELQSHVNLVCR